jgi:hypothetical protein
MLLKTAAIELKRSKPKAVLDGLTAADSGTFVAYDGARLPW